jgi:undecaprenyl-diphosphatase
MDALIIFCAKYLVAAAMPAFALAFYMQPADSRKKMAVFSALSLPLSYVLGLIARGLWFNARPFVIDGLRPLIAHAADNGFPSDHTLLLASLSSIAFAFDRRLSIALWLITAVVGAARVLSRVHHLADILGSIAIALVSAAVVYFVIERKKKL